MPKKKNQKKNIPQDVTINDCANALKPVSRVKKSTSIDQTPSDISWDQIQDDDFDIIEQTNADGTKNFVYKKSNHSIPECIDDIPGIVYPEIVWYFISHYIKPEDVGHFAGINKATYAITQRESFWRGLYRNYCENHPKLPQRLCIENSFKVYGLRQRVIRALYHTYDVFVKKVVQQGAHDSRPHLLVKRRCVNVWFCKGVSYWSIYFKFKKLCPMQRVQTAVDFLEELGRVDANPEENSQVLQVTCQSFYEVPPLMGMTLSSVSVALSQGFRHHRLHLGFNTGSHVSKDILPEYTVVLDTVVKILVFDWWHPKYPHFDNTLPSNIRDEESVPVLKKDFFTCQANTLSRQISCGYIPNNLLKCVGDPQIMDRSYTTKCSNRDNECDTTTCVFNSHGWLEGNSTEGDTKINKQKITDYFDKYAKDHTVWSAAVEGLKADCLGDVQPQGPYLKCAPYDVIHCIWRSFIWNAPASQWSTSAECTTTKQVMEACPFCPNGCFATAIPIGSCNACYLQPKRRS
ncbi:LOW QUALITY PROTEIN: transmembrane protein fates-shifted [Aphomia sociella]